MTISDQNGNLKTGRQADGQCAPLTWRGRLWTLGWLFGCGRRGFPLLFLVTQLTSTNEMRCPKATSTIRSEVRRSRSLQILRFCSLDLLRRSFAISCVTPRPRAPRGKLMEGTGASRPCFRQRLRQFPGHLVLFVRMRDSTGAPVCAGPCVCQVVGGVGCTSGSLSKVAELLGPVAGQGAHEWGNLSLKPGFY